MSGSLNTLFEDAKEEFAEKNFRKNIMNSVKIFHFTKDLNVLLLLGQEENLMVI